MSVLWLLSLIDANSDKPNAGVYLTRRWAFGAFHAFGRWRSCYACEEEGEKTLASLGMVLRRLPSERELGVVWLCLPCHDSVYPLVSELRDRGNK